MATKNASARASRSSTSSVAAGGWPAGSLSTRAALNTVNLRAQALRRRRGLLIGVVALVVSGVGDLPEDAEGAALAPADLGPEAGPLLVNAGEVEGEDVVARVAVPGGGIGSASRSSRGSATASASRRRRLRW